MLTQGMTKLAKTASSIPMCPFVKSAKLAITVFSARNGLKMLINRMYYLQGKFPCRENSIVITKLEESLMWLDKRTEDRKSRGVEGKHIK